jgi:putative endonuclease
MQYFVYILYSEKLSKYYIGSSSDPEDRLRRHNGNHKGFTSAGQPWKMVYKEAYGTKTEALLRERQLKNWKSRHMINSLIEHSAGSGHPD